MGAGAGGGGARSGEGHVQLGLSDHLAVIVF